MNTFLFYFLFYFHFLSHSSFIPFSILSHFHFPSHSLFIPFSILSHFHIPFNYFISFFISIPCFHFSQLRKEEKLQRARDLKTIQLYRDKNKHEGILSLLAANITTNYTIYPSFGHAEFFEFSIKNPYDTDQTISIQCEDQELTVIKDAREWRYFKKYVETHTRELYV